MRAEWGKDRGRTRLVGVTDLGRMMGTYPNLVLSVLDGPGFGRWEAGRSAGGVFPQRKGWERVHDWAGETGSSTSSSSSKTTTSGERTPPDKAANPPPPFKAQGLPWGRVLTTDGGRISDSDGFSPCQDGD